MQDSSPAPPSSRSILSLSIRDLAVLHAAYMPFLEHGGLFIPGTQHYELGDELFMLLHLLDEPERLPVAASVVWITPPNPQGKRVPGVGVQFKDRESAARTRIEKLLAAVPRSERPTHTL